MHAQLIARGCDENRESGLVREWTVARLGHIDRRAQRPSDSKTGPAIDTRRARTDTRQDNSVGKAA
jgi:hypothetical protein